MRGSDGLKVVINGIRVGLLPSLVCRASLRGVSAARCICLVTRIPKITFIMEGCIMRPLILSSVLSTSALTRKASAPTPR